MNIIFVGIGGALGAISRYLVVILEKRFFDTSFPLSTLLVNVLGSFLIGLSFSYFKNSQYSLFFITGFLGAFTTFSTFSNETVLLFDEKVFGMMALNIFLNITLSLLVVFLGRYAHEVFTLFKA